MAGLAALLLLWFLFGLAIGGGVGYAIGQGKGRGAAGFWLGAFLGLVGWIIVAVMEPSDEVRQQRQTETLAAAAKLMGTDTLSASGPGRTYADRECPWCAEHIKAAAKVCRFCGRDVEPLEAGTQPTDRDFTQELVQGVRNEFPNEFDAACACMQRLEKKPERPAEWLRELCHRSSLGAPLELAAGRIPLDWSGPVPAMVSEPVMPLLVVGDPSAAGEFGAVKAAHPNSYDTARALLAGLKSAPDNPGAWLQELCSRIDQGSPPQAAAARIPLDWQPRVRG